MKFNSFLKAVWLIIGLGLTCQSQAENLFELSTQRIAIHAVDVGGVLYQGDLFMPPNHPVYEAFLDESTFALSRMSAAEASFDPNTGILKLNSLKVMMQGKVLVEIFNVELLFGPSSDPAYGETGFRLLSYTAN